MYLKPKHNQKSLSNSATNILKLCVRLISQLVFLTAEVKQAYSNTVLRNGKQEKIVYTHAMLFPRCGFGGLSSVIAF